MWVTPPKELALFFQFSIHICAVLGGQQHRQNAKLFCEHGHSTRTEQQPGPAAASRKEFQPEDESKVKSGRLQLVRRISR